MKDQTPESVIQAIEYLMRTAQKHNIKVCGFAFSSEPMCLVNFGTCSGASSIELYQKLCTLADEKRQAGLSTQEIVGDVN